MSTPNKTLPTNQSVTEFINTISDEKKRQDCHTLLKLISDVTQMPPKMWGPSIIGFGSYHYKYESGREGDAGLTGFSPRAQNLTVYIVPGFEPYGDLMNKLGKYKTGVCCLYIKKLEDIDMEVLTELIKQSVEDMKKKYLV